jgi:hypothetical protein
MSHVECLLFKLLVSDVVCIRRRNESSEDNYQMVIHKRKILSNGDIK